MILSLELFIALPLPLEFFTGSTLTFSYCYSFGNFPDGLSERLTLARAESL